MTEKKIDQVRVYYLSNRHEEQSNYNYLFIAQQNTEVYITANIFMLMKYKPRPRNNVSHSLVMEI